MTIDVYILRTGGDPSNRVRVGMGFLIGPRHVLTCAHVVAESLRLRDVLKDQAAPPARSVSLALAFSHRSAPEQASIAAWWPERSGVETWTDLDDVALLELPETFVLPGDATIARHALQILYGQEVFAGGITAAEQYGVGLQGTVLTRASGNRQLIRSEQGDGVIANGYSGAALLTKEGQVVGMIAQKQQTQTGLFIRYDWLLQAPSIRAAWQVPSGEVSFLGSMAGTAALPAGKSHGASEWLSLPIRARLKRHLHECNRAVSFGKIEDMAIKPKRRSPAIGVFGCDDDDVPEYFYDRFQSRFLVEAGHAEDEIAHPPRKWEIEWVPWRDPEETTSYALDMMKRSLVSSLSADGPEPAAIREALTSGRSQAFYSVINVEDAGPDDAALLAQWSAYLGKVGMGGLPRSLVHLICLKSDKPHSPEVTATLNTAVKTLAAAGRTEVVVKLGLLTSITNRELTDWIEGVARRVPLQANQIYRLDQQASTLFAGPDKPRLRALERWLDQLNDQDS